MEKIYLVECPPLEAVNRTLVKTVIEDIGVGWTVVRKLYSYKLYVLKRPANQITNRNTVESHSIIALVTI